MVTFISTRGQAEPLRFNDVLLTGLARDGGLYVPEAWPSLDLAACEGLSYPQLAARVMAPFVAGEIAPDAFAAMTEDAYAGFQHRAVTPLKQLGPDFWLMELFHGPTLAFKDVAMQLLGRLFDHVLAARGQRVTVIGATSGDTGSAAIEACRDRDQVDVFILHPHGRTSEVQRRQMTTVASANVHNIAIEGSFDDCQDLVKAMFADDELRGGLGLTAVNSINWARIMAQTVYYVWASLALGDGFRPLRFAVPTGNFGNVYAAYVAKRMGVPIDRLVIGTNRNDILFRFLEDGVMTREAVVPTLSPSMDIQISSNFERYLFDLLGRDAAALSQAMAAFRQHGVLRVGEAEWQEARSLFAAARVDDEETIATIADIAETTGELVDPHTAVGLAAARKALGEPADGVPLVSLACAHPAKFPEAVERATGRHPALPPALADLYDRDERFTVLPADFQRVAGHIRDQSRAGQGDAA